MIGSRATVAALFTLAALTAWGVSGPDKKREVKMTEPARPEALSLFVGTWKTTGATRATADSPSQQIDSTDRYEWLEGRYFLIHHVDARTPRASKALEIIGQRAASGGYPVTGFDSEGRTFSSAYALDGRAFHISASTERFAGAFSEDGMTLSGTWERSEDGRTWQPWKDIKLTKSREP